jgi:hypothetical protein
MNVEKNAKKDNFFSPFSKNIFSNFPAITYKLSTLFLQIHPSVSLSTITIVLTTITTKSMVMFSGYRHGSNNSKMVAMDQRNDIFNNLVSLLCAYVGDRYWRFFDPIGAICIW